MASFVKNKTEIMQHVLKMQQILLLPKYIEWNFKVFFFFNMHSHMWTKIV
jgi:hypothetical protein